MGEVDTLEMDALAGEKLTRSQGSPEEFWGRLQPRGRGASTQDTGGSKSRQDQGAGTLENRAGKREGESNGLELVRKLTRSP